MSHLTISVVNVNGSFGLDGEKMMEEQAQFAFNDIPIWDAKFRKMMAKFGEMYKSCEGEIFFAWILDERATHFSF